MKNFLKENLREKIDNDVVTFSWYRLSILDVLGIFFTLAIILYLVGEQLQWEELLGYKIIPLNPTARTLMYCIVILLILYLTLNRRSVLNISQQQIRFRKRPLTGKRWIFLKSEIAVVTTKLKSQFYENEVGYYHDIYSFSLMLMNGKTIRIGSFSEEDCKRLKERLK